MRASLLDRERMATRTPIMEQGMEPRATSPVTVHDICPRYAWMMVPGMAKTADTASEQAKDFLIGSFNSRIYAGASKNPPAFASKPEMNPTPAAISASRVREKVISSSAMGLGTGAPDVVSVGEIKNERPNPITKIAVRISKKRAPVNLVIREPIIVAGIPTPMLHETTCQSISLCFQYCAEASNVPGIVAGRGDATAIKPGNPTMAKRGVAMALPPFPNNPPRNPIITPTRKAPRCCNFMPFGFGGGLTSHGNMKSYFLKKCSRASDLV
jgi:hypothetical protein